MKKLLTLATLATLLVLSSMMPFAQNSFAQTASTTDIPRLISYQGLLAGTAGQPVANGAHMLTIRFYADSQGVGPAVWSDNFNVTTNNGVFSILLGSQIPLPTISVMNQPLWVGVTVDSLELHPFSQLTSSPYAMTVSERCDHQRENGNRLRWFDLRKWNENNRQRIGCKPYGRSGPHVKLRFDF